MKSTAIRGISYGVALGVAGSYVTDGWSWWAAVALLIVAGEVASRLDRKRA